MHINYYSVDDVKLPEEILNLFREYNLQIPKLTTYGVEDATVALYKFENGLELNYGCLWCNDFNRKNLKKLVNDPDYYIKKQQQKEQEVEKNHRLVAEHFKCFDEKEHIEQMKNTQSENEKAGMALKLICYRLHKSRGQGE